MTIQIFLSDFGDFSFITEHLLAGRPYTPEPHGVYRTTAHGHDLELIHSGVTVLQSGVTVQTAAKRGAIALLLGSAGGSQVGSYNVIRSYYDVDFRPFRPRGESETMPFSVEGYGKIPGLSGFDTAESITVSRFQSEIPGVPEIAVQGGLPLLYDVEDYGFLYSISRLPEEKKPAAAAVLRTVTDSGDAGDFMANLKIKMIELYERVLAELVAKL
ncbi:MAG: hypothetical protein LBQ91_06470 [Oscillospiraceae bacterium]|jgi:hypothetical protein|nr:hypothetical protein [Oscillospiraceae bacterium]